MAANICMVMYVSIYAHMFLRMYYVCMAMYV